MIVASQFKLFRFFHIGSQFDVVLLHSAIFFLFSSFFFFPKVRQLMVVASQFKLFWFLNRKATSSYILIAKQMTLFVGHVLGSTLMFDKQISMNRNGTNILSTINHKKLRACVSDIIIEQL